MTTTGVKPPDAPEEQLWEREKDMIAAAAAGSEVNVSHGPFTPPAMEKWGDDRTIRACVLRRMLVDQKWPVHAKGVRLRGLRIKGVLDLEGAVVHCPLRMRECYFDDPGPVILDYASASLLTLTDCCLGGLSGNVLTVTKDLGLSGCIFTGPLCLIGADISGSLNCNGAQLRVPGKDGNALAAWGAKVSASVLLSDGFTAAGAVRLDAADFTGDLTCSGARLSAAGNGDALVAERLKVGGDMSLDGVHVEAGAVRLAAADVSGLLDCRGARLKALAAPAIKTGGDLRLDQGFVAEGPVSLTDAVIGGFLMCTGAQLKGADDDGLALDATRVKAVEVRLDGDGNRAFTAAGGVQLFGANISGGLMCNGAHLTEARDGNALAAELVKVGSDMALYGMRVEAGTVRLVGADVTGQLNCRGAKLKALVAFEAKTGGDLLLDQGFTAEGVVSLADAVIGGGLRCSGARLNGADDDGNALDASRVKAVNVWLDTWSVPGRNRRFTAAGTVQLSGADVSGAVTCSGARLSAAQEGGNALVALGLKTGGDLLLDEGFTAHGVVVLTDAVIGGGLYCSGAQLKGADGDGNVLVATRVKAANVWLDRWPAGHRAFTTAGTVHLSGADITGAVTCSGARLSAAQEGGNALVALGLKTGGDLLLDEGFTAHGVVVLTDAVIGGGLYCSGAQLKGADGDGNVLVATRVKAANVWLDRWPAGRRSFTTAGAVQLTGADISGGLTCSGAHLTAATQGGNALVADLAKIGGDTCLNSGFKAVGSVRFASAQVDGSLRLDGADLVARADAVALDATGAQVTRELVWAPSQQVHGTVSLEDAQIGQLEDDWRNGRAASGYWPRADRGRLKLGGFTYSRIDQEKVRLDQRLTWIGSLPEPEPSPGMIRKLRDAIVDLAATRRGREDMRTWRKDRKDFGFTPQPYEQLATVYQQAGHDSEARAVAIARRRDLRRYGTITRRRAFGNWLLDKTIQYGYQTWRAVVGIAVLYVVIFLLFLYAQHRGGLMVPVGSTAGLPAPPDAAHCMSDYPCYYPAGYAIDTVIPLVNVHQASNWAPDGSRPFGWLWVYASWAGTVFGWAFATLAVAGYTGLVRSPDAL